MAYRLVLDGVGQFFLAVQQTLFLYFNYLYSFFFKIKVKKTLWSEIYRNCYNIRTKCRYIFCMRNIPGLRAGESHKTSEKWPKSLILIAFRCWTAGFRAPTPSNIL